MQSITSKLSPTLLVMLCAIGISVFLHTYRMDLPCLNEDEAAQGYNTYSVLQTGYDEYGHIPLRYLSFGENKLPLTGMLSAPFIALFGLKSLTVRLPVLLLGIVFPLLFYGAAYALTHSRKVALVACLMSSTNTWLYTMSRHQHEAVVLVAITLLIIVRIYDHQRPSSSQHTGLPRIPIKLRSTIVLALLFFMGLYTYHSAKVIIPFLAITALILTWKHRKTWFSVAFIIFVSVFLLFGITEFLQPTNRLSGLSYFTHPVFVHEIQEGRRLGGSPLYYNKIVYGTHRAIQRSISYLSPAFLLTQSDPNPRYGSISVHLITLFEYVFFIVGLTVLWLKRIPSRMFLTLLLIVGTIPAAAALPTDSATRSFVLTVPLIIIASIGLVYVLEHIQNQHQRIRHVVIAVLIVGTVIHISSFVASAKAYFYEYLEDYQTGKAWQCGSQEMSKFVWKNYDNFDRFYITRANGQPYIFLLFHKPYPPREYQKIASPGVYNEYGFWEQNGFDKFVFQKPLVYDGKPKSAYIMTPQEAKQNGLDTKTLIPISHDGVVRYYVKENP